MSKDNPVLFDETDLKRQLKDLKEALSALATEKARLQQEFLAKQKEIESLSSTFNFFQAEEELNFACAIAGEEEEFDEKFLEMDKKLELEILTEEIKSVLPALETEALQWETKIHSMEKASKSSLEFQSSIHPSLLRTPAEQEEMIGNLLAQRARLKASMAAAVEDKRRDLEQSVESLRDLRCDVREAQISLFALIDAARQSKRLLAMDETRLDNLLTEQENIRKECKKFLGGRGWETEIYVGRTGSKVKQLQIAEVTDLLHQWMPPRTDLRLENITHVLTQLLNSPVSTLDSIDFDTFCLLCDDLLAQ